jgi:hypothetical protein
VKTRIILLLLCCLGCQNKLKVEKPDNLIPREEMANMLYDMFVISSSKGSSINVLKENGIQPDVYVLTKYGIDSLQFVNSNNYYAHDIDTYIEILTDVKERLDKEQESVQTALDAEAAEKKKTDSLMQISNIKVVPFDMDKELQKAKEASDN